MTQERVFATMRMTEKGKELALKLAKYHKLRGRGALFEKYMLEDVEKIKREQTSILPSASRLRV